MELTDLTYQGPAITDHDLMAKLPSNLSGLLEQINGFVQFGGGLHVRGACHDPAWHSLRHVWMGDAAFHRAYPAVRETDVPFAQDCVGDQFLLRGRVVVRLFAETGDVEPLGVGLRGFLDAAQADPVGFLSLEPLLRLRAEGGTLEPGQLLSVYPPFCMKTPDDRPASLRAIPAADRLAFLADLARQIANVPDGGEVRFKVVE